MEPTSSPDNTRPSPGLARFWQVRPDADPPSGDDAEMVALGSRRKPDQPPETPADLLTGFGVRPAAPRQQSSADPFGLTRAGRRPGPRNPTGGRPFSGPPARDTDHSAPTDEQPAPDQDVKSQGPEAGDPAPSRDGTFGGFRLGGTGRFLFGGRNQAAGNPATGDPGRPDNPVAGGKAPEPGEPPVAEVAEPGDPLGASSDADEAGKATADATADAGKADATADAGKADAAAETGKADAAAEAGKADAAAETGKADTAGKTEQPDGDEPPGATPADEPAAATPADADQDAADGAGPSDENGREDMNGRAGAPGYAQTGEAPSLDGTAAAGDTGEESPASDGVPRIAAGWATVPSANHPVTPTSGNPAPVPVSGNPASGIPSSGIPSSGIPASGIPNPAGPVSPGFAYPPAPSFTPDHPAVTLEPVSGAPAEASETAQAAGDQPAQEPAAETAPTSGGPAVSSATAAAIQYPTVQIPATRTPPDLSVDRANDTVTLPTADPATGFSQAGFTPEGFVAGGYTPSGYSLGRSPEAFGVASVTPAAPGAGSVTPPPAEFPSFPFPENGVTGLAVGGVRRGFEDEEAISPRRSASLEDVEPVRRAGRRSAAEEESAAGETEITRTVWDEDAARHFRAAWHEVKAEFVDDPVNALTRAHDLLTDAVNELTEVLLAERDDLDPLRGGTPDTESMRMAMRNYREFLERILSL
ncbi:hypothetical protein ACTI_36750 [Actinoplanes sp. OR16]|nr:hypothetical protein ACTI_36750 [Actinoplanes sp. OR16]